MEKEAGTRGSSGRGGAKINNGAGFGGTMQVIAEFSKERMGFEWITLKGQGSGGGEGIPLGTELRWNPWRGWGLMEGFLETEVWPEADYPGIDFFHDVILWCGWEVLKEIPLGDH